MFHQKPVISEWRKDHIPAFNELILSWNAARPINGKYLFYVSLLTKQWSPWILYAEWGSDGQSSFLNTNFPPLRVYQDTVEVLEETAKGFQIKIVTEGNAIVDNIYELHVFTNSKKDEDSQQLHSYPSIVNLEVKGLSQITLNHPRHKSLCSPTSTTAVARYLLNDCRLDPIDFAKKVWDKGFDIFGNWVFNVAQAGAELGQNWRCWVERASDFNEIYRHLLLGTPVIVSVKGPLTGSAQTYTEGHLLAVTGYNPKEQKVFCMDPAFPTDSETSISYDFLDFNNAWNQKGNIAYIFIKNNQKN